MAVRFHRLPRRWQAALWTLTIGFLAGFTALHVGQVWGYARALTSKIDAAAYDDLFVNRGPEARPVAIPEVVIVEIDSRAIESVGQGYPFPRALHARILRKLKQAGARVIGLDLLFVEPQTQNDDDELARALRDCGNVVLAANFTPSRNGYVDTLATSQNFPLESLREAAADSAPVDIPLQLLDNYSRNFWPTLTRAGLQDPTREEAFPTFGVSIAALYRDIPRDQLLHDLAAGEFGEHKLRRAPAEMEDENDSSQVRICYAGVPKLSCRYVGYDQVLNDSVPPEVFRDKIVLIGDTTAEGLDYKPTPMRLRDDPNRPGVEIQANIIHTLLAGHDIGTFPAGLRHLLVYAVALVVSLLILRCKPLVALMPVLFVAALVGAGEILLFRHRVFLPPSQLLLAGGMSYVLQTVYFYVIVDRRARDIRRRLGGYVGPKVLAKVAHEDYEIDLKGKRHYITVMFTDIAGFTSLSEKMDAQAAVAVLNRYCEQMNKIIFQFDGTLDKFLGDGIMIYFNAPEPTPDHERLAVECAIEMQRAMRTWNSLCEAEGVPPLKIRIGIHAGEAVVGEMGSLSQYNYTVIGDTVNAAARLEPLNKEFHTEILISETVQRVLPPSIQTRWVDDVQLRGREGTMGVYEVLCDV